VPVPAAVAALAGDRVPWPVWVNELGGITFVIGEGDQRKYVKWAAADSAIDLAAEAARLSWACAFAAVPRLLRQGADRDGSWILTSALPGEMAVTDRWKAEPMTAVTAIGQGLRAMHDALPVADCPFSWSADQRNATARRLARLGKLDPARWHREHQRLGVGKALEILAAVPSVDRLVVCHGDSCAPNTLLTDDGRFSGHVDLGDLGVADRWADLAVATWSTTWNFGGGWELPLLRAYGVEPDPERTRYYRLLYDLSG
jgi:kanamycin kinase